MIKFEFTLDEANIVLGALGSQLQQITTLVEKIKQQAAPQVAPAPQAPEVPVPQPESTM